jgi:spermidine/putrescine transport system ATP-binding protein
LNENHEVRLINVTKKYGGTIAAQSVSLDIERGEFLTLLGPSGCGKTTLLRMIAGFEIPDEGRVMLAGQDVTDVPPYRRDVTTVFQHYALFPHLDVFDNVAFGLKRRKTVRNGIENKVRDALEMVQLGALEKRRPSELSGGQQQRVALARALVLEPKVLLLDEPLAALDLKLRKQMQIELKSLQRRLGISFVFVTHDQEEALTMSDRIVVMNSGRIEQMGSAREIYERPRTEFVAHFIGDSNVINCTVSELKNDGAVIRLGGGQFHLPDCRAKSGEKVRVMIRPEKIRLSFNNSNGAIHGRIESFVYQGESTIWKISLEGGQEITALEQNQASPAVTDSRVGQEAAISWEPDSAVVLAS